jgi:preprotein translocase subunit SecD
MTDDRLKEAREYAVQQNINILRNRVNQLGVAEPLVQRQGADRIVVELPGIQDTARAKEILAPRRRWNSVWLTATLTAPLPLLAVSLATLK